MPNSSCVLFAEQATVERDELTMASQSKTPAKNTISPSILLFFILFHPHFTYRLNLDMASVCAALQKPAVATIGVKNTTISRASRRSAVSIVAHKQEQKVSARRWARCWTWARNHWKSIEGACNWRRFSALMAAMVILMWCCLFLIVGCCRSCCFCCSFGCRSRRPSCARSDDGCRGT